MPALNLQVPARLLEAYAVANTPAFLYRALREDPYVRQLREEFTFDELLENLRARADQKMSLPAIVAAYAQFVAALQLAKDDTTRASTANAAQLPWAERMIQIHLAAASTSNSPMQSLSRRTTALNEVTFEFSK